MKRIALILVLVALFGAGNVMAEDAPKASDNEQSMQSALDEAREMRDKRLKQLKAERVLFESTWKAAGLYLPSSNNGSFWTFDLEKSSSAEGTSAETNTCTENAVC
ncbi:MAG: hypothetical protein QNJ97_00440 [Myxococcota bacterium]|nr:hypothetical protein [Myxococcota bacterium]